jgi:hypothetical protein
MFPSKTGSPKWSLSLRLPHQNPAHTSPRPIRATNPAHLILLDFITHTKYCGGPGSSVGIATDYGLDGPRDRIPVGVRFLHTSRPALGPTQPPVQCVPGLSRGVNRPGRGADHPPPPSAEV